MEFGIYNRFACRYDYSDFLIILGYQKVDPDDDGNVFHEITVFNIGLRFRFSSSK
jgi:hypothetical protein